MEVQFGWGGREGFKNVHVSKTITIFKASPLSPECSSIPPFLCSRNYYYEADVYYVVERVRHALTIRCPKAYSACLTGTRRQERRGHVLRHRTSPWRMVWKILLCHTSYFFIKLIIFMAYLKIQNISTVST